MFNPLPNFGTKEKRRYQSSIPANHVSSLFYFVCFFCLLLGSCQKEHVVNGIIKETDDSSAVFSLAPDSACTTPHLNGNFIIEKPLTDSENIRFVVAVTKVGKWSLATDSLNGFLFAGNGTFTDTGRQLLTLKAYGTPEAVGNYFFTIATESVQNIFAVSILKSNVQIEPVPLQSYFKANIGGIPCYVEAPTIGPDGIPYGRSGGDTVSVASFVTSNVYPAPTGSGTLSIQKGFLYGYAASTEADFKKFFAPGAYPFSSSKCSNFIFPGMILTWVDSDNEAWGTLKEFGDQKGSSFTIVGIEDGHDNKGNYFVKVKSRLNCKLYNSRTGAMKALTDGELVSFFIK